MNFELNDEQRMLVESAQRYVQNTFDLERRRRAVSGDDDYSKEQWRQFAELGWLAITLPEVAGGLDWGVVELSLLMEQLGRGLVNEPIIDSSVLCASVLSHASSSDLAIQTLEQIAVGESVVALAHREAQGRSELETPIESTVDKQGEALTLNGRKAQIFYGGVADAFLVSAIHQGETVLLLVPADAEGVTVKSYTLIDGTCAADAEFNAVKLDAAAELLRGDQVLSSIELGVDKSIIAGCGMALGSMEMAMEMTADYLKQREQYGKPLAQFQALQHRMSEMLVETEQARSILYRALSLFNDPSTRREAVSSAKVLISKAARWVTAQGIQLHGGIGTSEEFAIGHHYKAMLVFEERFGDSEWHLEQSARLLSV